MVAFSKDSHPMTHTSWCSDPVPCNLVIVYDRNDASWLPRLVIRSLAISSTASGNAHYGSMCSEGSQVSWEMSETIWDHCARGSTSWSLEDAMCRDRGLGSPILCQQPQQALLIGVRVVPAPAAICQQLHERPNESHPAEPSQIMSYNYKVCQKYKWNHFKMEPEELPYIFGMLKQGYKTFGLGPQQDCAPKNCLQ